VLCKSPRWDAICYDRGGKTICTVPYSRWSKEGFPALNATNETDPPPRDCPGRTTKYMGVAAVVKQWEGEAPKILMMAEQQVGARRCGYLLVGTTAIDTAPQVKLFLRQILEVPDIAGVPLRFSASTQRESAMLSTLEIKQTQFDPSIFVAPIGYKALKSYADVFLNDQDRMDINDASEMLRSVK
jgi:hypothetical protein